MHRHLPALVLGCLLAFSAAAQPALADTPAIMFFPFGVSGTAPDTMRTEVPTRIGDTMMLLGGIRAVPAAATTTPATYRSAAKAAGADLYLTGQIASVGTSFSVIEQLVSARSGLTLVALTTTFRSLDELGVEGTRLHDYVVDYYKIPVIVPSADPKPVATATPVPTPAPKPRP